MVRRASSHHEFHRDVPECALAPGASFSVTFEKRGCRTMLQKHPHLRQRISETIASQMANGLFRAKFATARRWKGQPIWECRVNERSAGSVRVAFSLARDMATVLFVSPTLQKRAFGEELERFLGNDG